MDINTDFIKRILLSINYDTKMTLDENKKLISEQDGTKDEIIVRPQGCKDDVATNGTNLKLPKNIDEKNIRRWDKLNDTLRWDETSPPTNICKKLEKGGWGKTPFKDMNDCKKQYEDGHQNSIFDKSVFWFIYQDLKYYPCYSWGRVETINDKVVSSDVLPGETIFSGYYGFELGDNKRSGNCKLEGKPWQCFETAQSDKIENVTVEPQSNVDPTNQVNNTTDKKPTNVDLIIFGIGTDENNKSTKDEYIPTITEPKFDGNFYLWFNENFIYPEKALNDNIQGTVYVKFKVNADGTISNVMEGDDNSADVIITEDAINLIKKMPNWIPATKDNVNIECIVTLPIEYTLSD